MESSQRELELEDNEENSDLGSKNTFGRRLKMVNRVKNCDHAYHVPSSSDLHRYPTVPDPSRSRVTDAFVGFTLSIDYTESKVSLN